MSEYPDYSRDLGCGESVRRMRDELFAKLGYIVVAEQHLPPTLMDGLYDRTLDEFREATEEEIRLKHGKAI